MFIQKVNSEALQLKIQFLCCVDFNVVFLLHSELARFEEILVDYKSYKDLLFKLSPPEWQDAQRSKVMSGKGAKEDQNRELKDTAIRNGK